MNAIVCTQNWPREVQQLREVEKNSPKRGDVLIKIMTNTVRREDTRMCGVDIPGPGWQRSLVSVVLNIV